MPDRSENRAPVRNVNGYVAPALTVDAVLLRQTAGDAGAWEVLLVRRGHDPFKGAWALPGGFVDVGERVEDACLRELLEETGVRGALVHLLGVYSAPDRDPRGHTVTVTYACAPAAEARVTAGSDADDAAWHPLDGLPDLAFDHDRILGDAARWLADGGAHRLRARAHAAREGEAGP